MTIDGSNRLLDLADRVREADGLMAKASREAATRALEVGDLLIEAKGECRHGQWLPFLERAGMAERQAQRLMLLARSGLKSDAVSDLGMRDALEMAAKRKLPTPGEVLIVSVGIPASRTPIFPSDGEIDAYVFTDAGDPDRYHVVTWRDSEPESEPAAIATATRRALPADRPDMIFQTVDLALDRRQSEMRFVVIPADRHDVAGKVAKLREIVIQE